MAGGGGRFELDEPALSSLFSQGGMVWLHVAGLVVRITSLAKLKAPTKTGRLRQSITGIVAKTGPVMTSGAVGSDLDYALWVHEGTKPRTILPKDGHEFMVFTTAGGRKVYTNKINYPGSKANPFLRRALEEVMATQR